MTALRRGRVTPQRSASLVVLGVAGGALIHSGSIVALNGAGYAEPGSANSALRMVGRSDKTVDNTKGSDGHLSVAVRRLGTFLWANAPGADRIGLSELGQDCFILDDQTVAKTDGGGSRPRAGVVGGIDPAGVWVELRGAAGGVASQADHLSAIQEYIRDGAQTGATLELTDAGELNLVVTGGGPPSPPASLTTYFGTSDDDTPTGGELTIAGVAGVGILPAYAGDKHHLIARLASEGDISQVFYSDDSSQTNQIGAFTKFGSAVVPTGETEDFNVWVSNQALTHAASVVVTVR